MGSTETQPRPTAGEASTSQRSVLLVHPTFDRHEHYGDFADLVWKELPLSLGFLAGYLLERGVRVKIVDEQWGALSEERIGQLAREWQPDVVGISVLTPVFEHSLDLAQKFKRADPRVAVVLGNVHPTVYPEETLRNGCVDAVVRGEGEVTLWEYLQYLHGERSVEGILGLSYRCEDRIVHNEDRPFERNLDVFPRCAYELMRENLPPGVAPSVVLTSRGCPYRCIFCASRVVSGHAYRTHSPERVVEDVEYLIRMYGVRHVLIVDDNFVLNRRRVEQICGAFIERGLHRRLTWSCQARADAIDEDVVRILKEAGCVQLSFGIETGSQRLLDLIQKGERLEDSVRAVRLAHRAGIRTRGAFILGLPTETRKESLRTIRFAKSLPLDIAKFTLATPYPGTELFRIACSEGMQPEGAWSRMSTMAGIGTVEPVYAPLGRSTTELRNMQLRALLAFYLRPRLILNALAGRNPEIRIGSARDALKYFMAVLRMLKRLIPSAVAQPRG